VCTADIRIDAVLHARDAGFREDGPGMDFFDPEIHTLSLTDYLMSPHGSPAFIFREIFIFFQELA
jgi:hypothetical protein